ncbi:succinyl-diaminopimelate desuccinylase [Aquicella siphonis]|nr:succinyl-diaminopimelate desuccinylase [Aquicella siphonis]
MIEKTAAAVIDLARELIARPSITPRDAGCQELIRQRLKAMGFRCESMRFDEVDNLWARIGTAAPLLVFAGHTDVVPPGPESSWASPPFAADVRNGCLFGRGASDMKGALAAMLTAVERFLSATPEFAGSVGFLLTSDEEGPAVNGTAKVIQVLQERGEKIDFCIIGEPSSDQRVGDQIRVGRRGSLHGKLTVHGRQGHVAYPDLTVNPIHMSAPALHELASTAWDQGNAYYPPTTFQISNIHGGTGAANVVPGTLEVLFNYRFSTAVTVDQLKTRAESILRHHGLQFELDWHVSAQPFLTRQGKLITAAQQAIKTLTGLTPLLSTGGGTSDGRFIAPTGAEVIELGVSNATAHHINEHVNTEDLVMLANLYQMILTDIFK